MATAVGNIGGMEKIRLRKTGKTSPTINPYGHPHTKPQSNTGICIGSSLLPRLGICIVKKGITRPSAKNIADNARFFVVNLFIFSPPFVIIPRDNSNASAFCLSTFSFAFVYKPKDSIYNPIAMINPPRITLIALLNLPYFGLNVILFTNPTDVPAAITKALCPTEYRSSSMIPHSRFPLLATKPSNTTSMGVAHRAQAICCAKQARPALPTICLSLFATYLHKALQLSPI